MYIGCPFNSDYEPWHKAIAVPQLTRRIDIRYLKILVENGIQHQRDECTYIGQTTERKKLCGKFNLRTAYVKHTINMIRI